MNEVIESQRLIFAPLSFGNLDMIYRQFSDQDMCKYFSEPPCSWEEAKDIIKHYSNSVEKGYFRYAMINKLSNEFIGTIGYHYYDKDLKQVEIGYDIWKEFWRMGYVSEAIPVILELCFEKLAVDQVYVLVHPDNIASIKAVRKFGFAECKPCRSIDIEPQICLKIMRNTWKSKG